MSRPVTVRRFAIKSRQIVTPDTVLDGYIIVEAGRIAEICPAGSGARRVTGMAVEDVGSHAVLPGFVDTHVHVNEPGRTDWEGFETATKAAAAGGITTIVDMPLNSSPVTTTANAFKAKIDAARGKLHVDCGFYGGIVPGCLPDLQELLDAGVLGMKVFMIDSGNDDFPATGRDELARAAGVGASAGVPLLAHAERSTGSEFSPVPVTEYAEYEKTRPPEWEERAIHELIEIADETGCPVHVVHLSTASALPILNEAKRRGVPVSVESCPHYLYFDAETIPAGSTVHKCAPPIRGAANAAQLWAGLVRGEIDLLASDHSPCLPAMKLDGGPDLIKAWGGIASLELGPSVILTLAKDQDCSPTQVARWMSLNPAKLVGLDHRKGSIEEGKDADLAIWNLDERFVVDANTLHQRHKLTPYAGVTLSGRVYKTYIRGAVAFDSGSFPGDPVGVILTHVKNPSR